MKRTKTILTFIAALTALIMTAQIFAGCSGGETGGTSGGDTTAEPAPAVLLADGDACRFSIIRESDAAKEIINAISPLQKLLKERFGRVTYGEDFSLNEVTRNDIPEILIGRTNRPESADILNGLRAGDRYIGMSGSKIVVAGGTDRATVEAVAEFTRLVSEAIEEGKEGIPLEFLRAPIEFRKDYPVKEINIAGAPVSEYTVVYGNADGLGAVAQTFADAIADACGYVIPVHRHRTSDISAEKLIVFGYCQMLEEAKKLHEALPEDNTGLPYTAKMSGGNLYFSGADFWAVSAASSEVLNGYVLSGSDVPADLSLSGNGRGKTIFPLSAGADIRIMTNNVWKCDSNQPDWIALGENCSAEARSPGFADVYLAFKPDIINLQEMSPKMISLIRKSLSERGSSYSLITYYPSEQDDTPILYNRETLKFIDTGHHLFSYGNNSKTKGYTWCYFEHLPTGKKFVSLSTHLWWKSESAEPGSNEWRRRQAEEIVRLSDELIRKYDCPVFVQGDFNTQTTTAAYAEFMNGGFEDCHDIAATADNTRGHHSCGSTGYSRELYSGNYKSNAIDHMIVKNRGGARILTFRQPVTDFYWPLTDHIPVYIDVKF